MVTPPVHPPGPWVHPVPGTPAEYTADYTAVCAACSPRGALGSTA